MIKFAKLSFSLLSFFLLSALFTTGTRAFHAWGNYHWARTANLFTLKLGDNVNSNWDSFLATTSYDWSLSSVLDTAVVAGGTNPKTCRPTSGQVEVCNSKYGNNGWLGIAQIWATGDHIAQGVTKMNDTYFNKTYYNKPTWKNLVMCQEVGHTLGLDHQDEIFDNANLFTCMDYTSSPDDNQHPNAHDYEELETIYSHLDTFTTVGQVLTQSGWAREIAGANFDSPREWGRQIKGNRDTAVFERDFGGGLKLFTFVIWAR